mgnify:CR=1 FL=1
MGNKPDIVQRTRAYALSIISLYRELEKDNAGRILGKQLLRSGTSVGANVHEAQGGQSKADFISKISIAYKEALESEFWLRLVQEDGCMQANGISKILDETSQLIKILSSILLSSKSTMKNEELRMKNCGVTA